MPDLGSGRVASNVLHSGQKNFSAWKQNIVLPSLLSEVHRPLNSLLTGGGPHMKTPTLALPSLTCSDSSHHLSTQT